MYVATKRTCAFHTNPHRRRWHECAVTLVRFLITGSLLLALLPWWIRLGPSKPNCVQASAAPALKRHQLMFSDSIATPGGVKSSLGHTTGGKEASNSFCLCSQAPTKCDGGPTRQGSQAGVSSACRWRGPDSPMCSSLRCFGPSERVLVSTRILG